MTVLKAPFPYFGGKSKIAGTIWKHFGNVKNYVEPFAGSLAVLLARNNFGNSLETVNDVDGFVTNFWRAIKDDPETLSLLVNYPVSEIDLNARHEWMIDPIRKKEFVDKLWADPDFYDIKFAAWWCWGISQWIGSGWGIEGSTRQLPHLGNNGKGVHKKTLPQDDPCSKWFEKLSQRLKRVRICCGDWSRVCTPSVTIVHGLTAVFLDPPYGSDRKSVYAEESFSVAGEVNEWCVEAGKNGLLRIVLAGHEGEHNNLEAIGWKKHCWSTNGGYGNQGDNQAKLNKDNEVLWISPHCERQKHELF